MTPTHALVGAGLGRDPDAMAAELSGADTPEDVEALLQLARVLEPPLRLTERTDALRRAAAITTSAATLREIDAERAIDLAKQNALDEAESLAREVLARSTADELVAQARATEALGRVYAWRGTSAATARAKTLLEEAADRYAALGTDQWRGFVLFWLANAVHFQRGELAEAERGMRAALPLLGPIRQAVLLSFLGDLLGFRGALPEARDMLADAERLAGGDPTILAYICWSRAKLSSYSGDAQLTLRLIEEADRDLTDLGLAQTLPNTIANFLADAADMLERVGQPGPAARYLARAQRLDPDDEFVRLAEAASLARHGDPDAAIAALRQVLLEPWLEARLVWRVTLLAAWAELRAGRADAALLAARALTQVAELGGLEVALTTESFMVRSMLPLAAAAGSSAATELLHGSSLVVRLLGAVSVGGGTEADFPPGQPGELARLVLSHAGGSTADQVCEAMWPTEEPELARRRLRQVLSRLGTRLPGLIVRREDRLMGGVWVDSVAFEKTARAALANRDPQQCYAALALWGGLPLPTDPYAPWAAELRERLVALHVRLLDELAVEAAVRESHREAARLLEAAIADDRYDELRYEAAARHRMALGERSAARALLRRAVAMLAELDLPEPAGLARLRRELTG